MNYATGHKSFTSLHLLNIYIRILQTLQIVYNTCRKEIANLKDTQFCIVVVRVVV
jgi:hypothetical protein